MTKSTRGQVAFIPEWLGREGILAAICIMTATIVILFILGRIFPLWVVEATES